MDGTGSSHDSGLQETPAMSAKKRIPIIFVPFNIRIKSTKP